MENKLSSYIELERKFNNRLQSPVFLSDREELSAYDIISAIRSEMGPYNVEFFEHARHDIKSINLRNGYSNPLTRNLKIHKLAKIGKISFNVLKDGNVYFDIYLYDNKNNYIGYISCDENFMSYMDIHDVDVDKYSVFLFHDLLHQNASVFKYYIDVLKLFKDKFPGLEYRWDEGNPYEEKYSISDGFITTNINLNDINSSNYIRLESDKDFRLSFYGDLYKKVINYSEELAKRTSVNIEDLHPVSRRMVEKYYGLEKKQGLVKELGV